METVQRAESGHLLAFDHQVAGQSLVFQYDNGTICKSLIPREHEVYRALPPVLKPFIPMYRGVVDIPLMDHVTTELGQQPSHVKEALQRHLAKVRRSEEQGDVYRFLLLENLVAGFRQPCVLDLKLGTRQHGDDAPAEKVEYQVNKCRNTTSCSLGVRLCGMKVFQTTGDYVTVDKAEGRRMNQQDLERAVERFLHNGRCLRRDVIPAILQRLRCLKAVIEGLPSFRFYSSSLLIVYDGHARDTSLFPAHFPKLKSTHCPEDSMGTLRGTCVMEQVWENKLGGRGGQGCMCECPCLHATSNTQCPLYGANADDGQRPSESIDLGRLNDGGNHDTDDMNGRCALSQYPDVNGDVTSVTDTLSKVASDTLSKVASDTLSKVASDTMSHVEGRVDAECRVDVRLVDFAHTTFEGLGGVTVLHPGVDRGCLLGLQTLNDIFTRLLQDSH